jgi:hypothetical protein
VIASVIAFALGGCALPEKSYDSDCGNGGCVLMIPLGASGEGPDASLPRSPASTSLSLPLPSVRLEKDLAVILPPSEAALSGTGAVDNEGKLHLFLGVQRPHEWQSKTFSTLYFVIDHDGVSARSVSHEMTESDAPIVSRDAEGKVYVFIAGDPGKMSSFDSGKIVFIREPAEDSVSSCSVAGGEPICGYLTNGPKIGEKVKWDLAVGFFGGPSGGLPILLPLPYRATAFSRPKVVVVKESEGIWTASTMLDSQSGRAAHKFKLAGDNAGNVDVLSTDFGNDHMSLVYSVIGPQSDEAAKEQSNNVAASMGVEGHVLLKDVVDDLDLAVDPRSGAAQVAVLKKTTVFTQSIIGEHADSPSVLADKAVAVRLAAAGEDRFHALIATRDGRLVYRLIEKGAMSEPVDIGSWSNAYVPGFLVENAPHVFAIVANPSGNAFAVWDDHIGGVRVREITLKMIDRTQN